MRCACIGGLQSLLGAAGDVDEVLSSKDREDFNGFKVGMLI